MGRGEVSFVDGWHGLLVFGLAFIDFWLVEAKVALWPPFAIDEGPERVEEIFALF